MANRSRKKLTIKEFLVTVIFMIVTGAVMIYVFPWWCCLLGTALVALFRKHSAFASFSMGFLAIAVLWIGAMLYYTIPNEGMLANQMGQLIGGMSGTVLTIVTALLGGICGGLGGWSGSLLGKAIR